MKPFHILLFMLSVFLGMFILSISIPKDGFKLNDELTIYFPTVGETFLPEENKYVDITEIVEQNQVPDTLEQSEKEENHLNKAFLKDSTIVYYQPINIKPGQVRQKIEYGKNSKEACRIEEVY